MTTFTGTNTGAVVAMLDNSDGVNKYYAVARLADNRCWMISNYARAYGTKVDVINNGTWTNGTAGTTAFYVDPADATPFQSGSIRVCVGVGYATTAVNAIAYLSGSGSTTAGSVYNCGYLYNWYGATAGSGSSSSTAGIVTGSICPLGWHLPSTNSTSAGITIPTGWASATEFLTMYSNINGGTITNFVGSSSAFRSTSSGQVASASSIINQGSVGGYWSSYASGTSYTLRAYSAATLIQQSYMYSVVARYTGQSVRCVLNV
jgi:uncharacterized protein (TIGR02145 family)